MGMEIERKFLLRDESWRREAVGTSYTQGYISKEKDHTVRIRIAGEKAYITIKGAVEGISRPEFEYVIPLEDARELMKLCKGPLIDKTRYRIPFEGLVWEVDVFHGENLGLIVAEVELTDPDQRVVFPPWVGEEVTGDPRFYNSSLSILPFGRWEKSR
jgi:adenylate cyclase